MNKHHDNNFKPLKFFGLFKMAVKNFFSRSWMNAKMCIAFASLAFLVCLFTVYNTSLSDRRYEMRQENISGNFIWSDHNATNLLNEYDFDEYDTYTCKIASLGARMVAVHGDNAPSCTTKYVVLNFDGQKLRKEEDASSITVYLHAVDSSMSEGESTFFTPLMQQSLKYKFNLDSPFVGVFPNDESEVMISVRILKSYGIDVSNPQALIGKSLSARIDGDNVDLFDATICGVILDEYYTLTGIAEQMLRPDVITHENNPFFRYVSLERRYMYCFSEWLDIDAEVLKDICINNRVLYGAQSMYTRLKALDQVMRLANTLYIVIGSALIVGLILTVYLMIDKYIKVYSRTSGIYSSLGMTRRSIYLTLFMQIFLIVVMAIPMSIVMTAVGYTVITKLVQMATGIAMSSSLGQISAMLSLGIASVLLVAIVFTVYVVHRLKGKSIKKLLNSTVD